MKNKKITSTNISNTPDFLEEPTTKDIENLSKRIFFDLPKNKFLGWKEATTKTGKKINFAVIRYDNNKSFISFATKMIIDENKTTKNNLGDTVFASRKTDVNAKNTEYDFIRLSLNPVNSVSINVYDPKQKKIAAIEKITISSLLKNLEKERNIVRNLKQNKEALLNSRATAKAFEKPEQAQKPEAGLENSQG